MVGNSAGLLLFGWFEFNAGGTLSANDKVAIIIVNIAVVAMLIGLLVAIVCYICVKLADKFKWGDALDVWGVHGMGGMLGIILIGFLANPVINGVYVGVH